MPSLHGAERMIERGFSELEVRQAIDKGAKRLERKKIISNYRKMEVVYRAKPCHFFVITVYPV